MTINVTSEDAVMIRRAIVACRNLQRQASRNVATANVDWFDWVPKHLERLAERLEYPDTPTGQT